MSTNLLDGMTEREAKSLLNDICCLLKIGGAARKSSVILQNIENAIRRSNCLSRIENHHTIVVLDDDNEEMEEQLLNWGESPEKYIKTYKAVIGE